MTPTLPGSAEYSENTLIEQPAIALFGELGWSTVNCFREWSAGKSTLGRETEHHVVLVERLVGALEKLNADLPDETRDAAIAVAAEELMRDRSTMSAVAANREIWRLLRDGVKTVVRLRDGSQAVETVRVIDWRNPAENDFLLASQFWVAGDMYRRRCDLVGFVNGLPLMFVELKATHKHLKHAFDANLTDYRITIPQLFQSNALIILSNGSASRVGSITAGWEHFGEWKKVDDEGEEGVVSLETMIRGTCERTRLLDIIENFTLFEEGRGGLVKKVAMNHQYLGVNRAIAGVRDIRASGGRLGVFWHTQGSGKSISMVFFAQKILRMVPGNWTFVIVTDRKELDEQIYKQFVSVGAVTEAEAHAESGEQLRRLLIEDHRYVFTLIQKFRTERGENYPELSDRSDIIVITDEAHRSQYDIFAANMRAALPNASFIGFTGTPLIAGEELTRDVFGDYVSIYDFKQSRDDGATVPLYYENRIPELQLTNEQLNEDIYRVIEEADLDEAQQERLERELGRQYHLITRDDRLDAVARDIVRHFAGRGFQGKAMVISIDKATAVRMYDKVRKHWDEQLGVLQAALPRARVEERELLERQIAALAATDMAVVVSQSQNEIAQMQAKGVDIVPHRRRMVTEDLDEKFKDPADPLRLVFVCAMWMTGFDVPSCSTIYIDKPMRNHTLMQTIARANRRFEDKAAGHIVDYVGVFRNLQKALAIYGQGMRDDGTTPVLKKEELVAMLRQAIAESEAFCDSLGVDLAGIRAATAFEKVKLLDDAVDAIVASDETKKRYAHLIGTVARLYNAVLPDPAAGEFTPICALLGVIAAKIRALTPQADISGVMAEIERLLDESIAIEGYRIRETPPEGTEHLVDLSAINFDQLRDKFASTRHKRTEVERLRAMVNRKLQQLVLLNRMRADFLERYQAMIDEYNAGSVNIQQFFDELMRFTRELDEEERRGIAEGLTEEELALFDLLTRPEPRLTKAQEIEVKSVVRSLLETLKREKLVLDWRKRQQSRAEVRLSIETALDMLPQKPYPSRLFEEKCRLAYQHVYDSYHGDGASIYGSAA